MRLAFIVQRYGKDIQQDAVEHAVEHGARAVLETSKLQPVVNPTVSNITPSEQGITFQITVEIAPQVVLGEYSDLSFTRDPIMCDNRFHSPIIGPAPFSFKVK